MWSNKAERVRFVAEKAHSLGFAVRVEDRLHRNIIQSTDQCFFTVRPAEFVMGINDNDITGGTISVVPDGVRSVGTRTGTGEGTHFAFQVQAAELNLDPEEEYWYDITYVRDGYSLSVAAGVFEVAANVTNRAVASNFVTSGNVFQVVAGVDGHQLLTVQSTMPMPQQGSPGNGSYVIAQALPEIVGNSVTVQLSQIVAPQARPVQVGDVIFSSVTRGVLSTVQSISFTGVPSATLVTRQVYGQQALKALLDIELHITPTSGPSIEDINYVWTVQKSSVPLPPGYEYRVGDLVFSHSAVSGFAVTKKLLISTVESQTSSQLTLRTRIVFPMFLDTDDIEDLLASYIPADRRINGFPLDTDLQLTEDHIPAGSSNAKFTNAQNVKLNGLPTNAQLNTSLNGKANSSHTHTMANVSGLSAALNGKVNGTNVNTVRALTLSQYNAINPKDPQTLYFITG